jgi:hypothetical protein
MSTCRPLRGLRWDLSLCRATLFSFLLEDSGGKREMVYIAATQRCRDAAEPASDPYYPHNRPGGQRPPKPCVHSSDGCWRMLRSEVCEDAQAKCLGVSASILKGRCRWLRSRRMTQGGDIGGDADQYLRSVVPMTRRLVSRHQPASACASMQVRDEVQRLHPVWLLDGSRLAGVVRGSIIGFVAARPRQLAAL